MRVKNTKQYLCSKILVDVVESVLGCSKAVGYLITNVVWFCASF